MFLEVRLVKPNGDNDDREYETNGLYCRHYDYRCLFLSRAWRYYKAQ